MTPERIEELINYYFEQASDRSRRSGKTLNIDTYKALVVLKTCINALDLMATDYCENMGCSFCKHHAKCLEENHFEDVKGKEFLQKIFIEEARK